MSVYKGNKLVAGGSIDTHFVRRPAWNQAVTISVSGLRNGGYKVPADGMLVGTVVPDTGTGTIQILCNGIILSVGMNPSNWLSSAQPHTIVNAGDVISLTSTASISSSTLSFVPFEDSTVNESDIEVVTPEYIRNQNILSDLETVTIGTSSAAATTMQYDGFIIFDKGNVTLSYVYVNNVVISRVNNVTNTSVATTVPVKKGDTVYITNQQDLDFIKARFYKLRDYTGR